MQAMQVTEEKYLERVYRLAGRMSTGCGWRILFWVVLLSTSLTARFLEGARSNSRRRLCPSRLFRMSWVRYFYGRRRRHSPPGRDACDTAPGKYTTRARSYKRVLSPHRTGQEGSTPARAVKQKPQSGEKRLRCLTVTHVAIWPH